ncbi:MAG: hypothetical protein QM784_25860 [Polyangiaceae bacterium]
MAASSLGSAEHPHRASARDSTGEPRTLVQGAGALRPSLQHRSETQNPSSLPEVHQKTTRSGNFVLWTDQALRDDGTYDAVIHFHGIPQALAPALRESGLAAVVLVLEGGLTTDDYKQAFGLSGTLSRLLASLRVQVSAIAGGREVREHRVAVSAWSAGSGAILPMLKRPEESDGLDAVILADGLHASFVDPRRRKIGDAQLEPIRAFATEAVEGRRFFGITHTAIRTPNFGSTTETAARLLEMLDLSPIHVLDPPDEGVGPRATTRTERGDLIVLGFAGEDRRAHAEQQWALGRTLWKRLAKRWGG